MGNQAHVYGIGVFLMADQAGMFAGEVTKLAPANNEVTDKPRGYVWMENDGVVAVFEEPEPEIPAPSPP